MLSARKVQLLAGLKVHGLELRNKELDFYMIRFAMTAGLSSIMTCLSYVGLIKIKIPEPMHEGFYWQVATFYVCTSLSMVLSLYNLVLTSFSGALYTLYLGTDLVCAEGPSHHSDSYQSFWGIVLMLLEYTVKMESQFMARQVFCSSFHSRRSCESHSKHCESSTRRVMSFITTSRACTSMVISVMLVAFQSIDLSASSSEPSMSNER